MKDKNEKPEDDSGTATGKDIAEGRKEGIKKGPKPVIIDKNALNEINSQICECDDRLDRLKDQAVGIKAEKIDLKEKRHSILYPPEPEKQAKIEKDDSNE